MKTLATPHKWVDYAKRHWHKLIIGMIVIYAFYSKDISFSFQLTPAKEPIDAKIPVEHISAPKQQEMMTYKLSDSASTKRSNPGSWQSMGWGLFKRNESVTIKDDYELINHEQAQEFLDRFYHVAKNEQEKFGIPSSIVLANGLLHSLAGGRDYTIQGNNYFGIPCTSDWDGLSGNYFGKCLRKYDSAWMSFRDHSQFLNKMEPAKLLHSSDYQQWATFIEGTGYSGIPNLGQKLIKIIQELDLFKYDEA